MTNLMIEVAVTPEEQLTVVCCGWCGVIEGMASCAEQCLEASTEARETMPHQFATTRSIPKPALLTALLKDAGAVKIKDDSGSGVIPEGWHWLLHISEGTEG